MATRGTILVVDDNPDIAALMREVLTEEDYRVLVAQSVADALVILGAFTVGLVLTDAFHPAPGAPDDRWSPVETLVRASRGTPLVLCSARNRADYADFAAHGVAAYLPKPFDLDGLLDVVGATLPPAAQG